VKATAHLKPHAAGPRARMRNYRFPSSSPTPRHMLGKLISGPVVSERRAIWPVNCSKMMTGIDMVHVPYRGDAPALTGLLGGQVQVYFGNVASSVDHVRSGKLHPVAVTTTGRSQSLPDLSTVADFIQGHPLRGMAATAGRLLGASDNRGRFFPVNAKRSVIPRMVLRSRTRPKPPPRNQRVYLQCGAAFPGTAEAVPAERCRTGRPDPGCRGL
jgi:Tripartite tricarboxylate transporter family receptor